MFCPRQADLRERHGVRRSSWRSGRGDGAVSSRVADGVSSLLQTHSLRLEKKKKNSSSVHPMRGLTQRLTHRLRIGGRKVPAGCWAGLKLGAVKRWRLRCVVRVNSPSSPAGRKHTAQEVSDSLRFYLYVHKSNSSDVYGRFSQGSKDPKHSCKRSVFWETGLFPSF